MSTRADDGEPKEEAANEAKALWTRPRSDLTDTEYQEFYRHVSHDFQEPLTWSHNKVEGKREYTSLLYVPARAPWDLWNRAFRDQALVSASSHDERNSRPCTCVSPGRRRTGTFR